MNKSIDYAALGLGGLSLFTVCFLGFASMSGVPLHEVAVVGALFSPPDEPEPSEPTETVDPADLPPPDETEVIESGVAVLGGFRLPAPFEADEIQELVSGLKAARLDLDRRLERVEQRETEADARLETLQRQFTELESMRLELEALEEDLALRIEEAGGAEASVPVDDPEPWRKMSRMFEEGDVDDLATRLASFPPDAAAEILLGLDSERAAALLNALPAGDTWRRIIESYGRKASGG